VRVIAGEKGGRRLLAPAGEATRPTADRVREAMFSMLDSHGAVKGASVWDLFAGSGALGIEALSRGASHTTFVDQSRRAVQAVRSNLARLGYDAAHAQVVCAEVLRWAHGLDGSPAAASELYGDVEASRPGDGAKAVDLVIADPPYAWQGWPALLAALAPFGALLVTETGQELELPEGWRPVKVKRYGATLVTLAEVYNRPSATTAGSS
jgi:16S rRNA (guanine966-N2)-methyltransferase